METATQSLALYFIVLRHRTLSPTIHHSEVIRKPFALSQVFFIIQRREKCCSRKEKCSSP